MRWTPRGESDLRNAYALPSAGLSWRDDGRAHLGAPIDALAASLPEGELDTVIVAYTPFHRPPHRDDVLGKVLSRLQARFAAPILLADCDQSGQHYVEAPGPEVLAAIRRCAPG